MKAIIQLSKEFTTIEKAITIAIVTFVLVMVVLFPEQLSY